MEPVCEHYSRAAALKVSNRQLMVIYDSISRLLQYRRRHGFWTTLGRLWLSLKLIQSGNRMLLFCCELCHYKPSVYGIYDTTVERKTREEEMDARDLLQIVNVWTPEIGRRQFSERFA